MAVRVTKDIFADILKRVKELTKAEVLIGIPDANADRKAEPDEKADPITNAAIGYIHEFGAPEKNIPARPFLIPGVQSIKADAIKHLKRAGEQALDGSKDGIVKEFTKVGLLGQKAVQARITDGPFAPLAPATLAARRRRGRTGDKPLIDTGQLRRSITFVIGEKGKEK